MGVYVEKEWRYRKSKNASESAFSYKINQIRKGNTSNGRKGSREVFVKFTKGAKSRAGIRNAIKYISRDYKLELLDSEGLKQSSKEDIEDTIRFMQMHTSLPQKYGVDLTKSLTFSPPKIAGVSKEHTLEAVRKTLTSMYPDNYFVMGYHIDTKNPHVHVIINVSKSDGTRIRISGDKDYDEMKQRFANKLKNYGYDVKSTIKKEEIREEWKELISKTNRNEYEVVEFGSSSYQLDKTKDRNHYLVYRTNNGKEVTVWGKEIISEIKNNDVRVGDKIKLKKIGTRDIKVPVYSKDGSEIVSWKDAKRNIWEITNLSRDIEIKPETDEDKFAEIKLDGDIRQQMQMKSREEFTHEKNMLLNPEYKQKYEEEQKLKIKQKHIFKF
ncbi:MAG: relaxase/mobilization nuclease domain-containing protein [Rickettsia endosymbiont of Glossina mortisans submortisans]|nr:relaxase/mobilization nuclease domain-containing protein [Rickettsia endosymbiont of Glossina mortisans submortisans]